MKVAIITDVHGNSSALRSVLEDIDRQSDISHIYCLGDMVAIGHETDEVLELLFSRDDVSSIVGNHEDELMSVFEGKALESQGGERLHHEWLVSRMDKKFIPKLAELPRQLSVEHEGKRLLFVHYHLDAYNKFLPMDNEPSAEKLDGIYKGFAADIVCFGHRHTVHHFETKHRIYLNPGSLGCNHQPLARYAVLNIKGQIQVQLREVRYDNKEFLKKYELLDIPDKDFILKFDHGNQHQV
jgi:putative phosphoesterase